MGKILKITEEQIRRIVKTQLEEQQNSNVSGEVKKTITVPQNKLKDVEDYIKGVGGSIG